MNLNFVNFAKKIQFITDKENKIELTTKNISQPKYLLKIKK
jgi:hypothetical protein